VLVVLILGFLSLGGWVGALDHPPARGVALNGGGGGRAGDQPAARAQRIVAFVALRVPRADTDTS
jgi:hypothetical protein